MQQPPIQDLQKLIADAILEHRLVPGQHLNEAQVAKAFRVSRSSVRQALIALENDGLVRMEQNRGAFVAKPSLDEATQLFVALASLEKAATDLILSSERKVSREALSELETLHHRGVKAQKGGRLFEAMQLSIEFHLRFVSFTGNGFLLEMHRKLLMQYRLVTAVFRTSMDYCALDDHHLKMVSRLREGDGLRLKRLIEAHWKLIVLGHATVPTAASDLLTALKV
jgi:DNA-binding GntR family transcriptional regulator